MKAAVICRATGNIRGIQILLGRSKIYNSVGYLGLEIKNALLLAGQTEV